MNFSLLIRSKWKKTNGISTHQKDSFFQPELSYPEDHLLYDASYTPAAPLEEIYSTPTAPLYDLPPTSQQPQPTLFPVSSYFAQHSEY